MSAVTEIAKKAFPIAVIAVLSGSYYYANFVARPIQTDRSATAGNRTDQQQQDHRTSPDRLEKIPANIQDLPQSTATAIAPQHAVRDYHVRTAAGQFTENHSTDSAQQASATTPIQLDDFQLELQLQPPSNTPVSPQNTPSPSSDFQSETAEPIVSSIRKSSPIGSHNGHVISNPYMNDSGSPRTPIGQLTTQLPATDSSEPTDNSSQIHLANLQEDSADSQPDSLLEPSKQLNPQGTLQSILENSNGSLTSDLSVGVSPQSGNGSFQPPRQLPTTPSQPASVATARVMPLSNTVINQIRSHLEYGNSLARRSATLLAKRQFTQGLRIVAETSDNRSSSPAHLEALQQGFTALREAADFDNVDDVLNVDLKRIADAHDTPIVRLGHFEPNTPSQARKAYLLYAQDRIVQAVGSQPISADLLYALGKTHLVDATHGNNPDRLDFARAAVLFQCSLIVVPQHLQSANELGVILAKSGRLADAKILFQNAVQNDSQFSEGWNNLAKVHQQLGETQLAQLASYEAGRQTQSPHQQVQLLQNEEFNNLHGAWGIPSTAEGQRTAQKQVVSNQAFESTGSQSLPAIKTENIREQNGSRPMFTPVPKTESESSPSWFGAFRSKVKPNTTKTPTTQSTAPPVNSQSNTFKTFGGF